MTETDVTIYRAHSLTLPAPRGALSRDLGVQVLAALQASARSAHTERAYKQAIGLFLQYLGGVLSVDLGETLDLATAGKDGRASTWSFSGKANVLRLVEPRHLDGFRSWRESQGDGANTASVRSAAVATFLSVCYRDKILSDKQALGLGLRPYKARGKRDQKPTGRRLSKEEVRRLRATFALVGANKGLRDRAILDTALYAGLRCDELASLDLAHFVTDKGRWWIRFAGKGQKTRQIKVHDTLFESVTAWLTVTGRALGQGAGAVFVSINKGDTIGANPINTSTINRLVAEYGHRAGLAPFEGENRLSPHDLRRTCARNCYENGAPLPMIQRLLGHADVSTTMRYIGADDEDNGGAVDFVRY